MSFEGELSRKEKVEDIKELPIDSKRHESSYAVLYGCSLPKGFEKGRENEDTVYISAQNGFGTLLDGAGGHAGGREASTVGREVISKYFLDCDFSHMNDSEIVSTITSIYQRANDTVVLEGKKTGKTDMATTAVSAQFVRNEAGSLRAVISHTGDSRAYILRKHGRLEQLTIDHDHIADRFLESEGPEKVRALQHKFGNTLDFDDFSEEEKELFLDPSRLGITDALGIQGPVRVDISFHDVEPGDKVILLSDGITDNLTDDEIQRWLETSSLGGLIRDAHAKSIVPKTRVSKERSAKPPKPDDMSVVMIEAKEHEDFSAENFKDLYEEMRATNYTSTNQTTKDLIGIIQRLRLRPEFYLNEYNDRPLKSETTKDDIPTLLLHLSNRNRGLRDNVINLLKNELALQ